MHRFLNLFLTLLLLGFGPLALSQEYQGSEEQSDTNMGNDGGTQDGAGDASTKTDKVYLSRIRVLQLDALLGDKSTTVMDTIPLHFQNITFPEKSNTLGSQHLGNLGSPFQSIIYMDRTEKTPFIFGRVYENWLTSPSEQIFYNTTTPYTNLRYLTTFGNEPSQEENFKFLFTVNVNKYLNIGVDYEILYARGFYKHNSNRDKLANIFGNYQSPRYEAFWKLSFNNLENFDNGGITNDEYITQPLKMSGGFNQYESSNIPVQLTDAKSLFNNTHFFLNHKYHLGFERVEIVQKDSVVPITMDTVYTFVPVSSFIHTLYVDLGQRSYRSNSTNSNFYDHTYLDRFSTADTSSLLEVRNTIGLSLVEGFHKWAKFGLTAFLEHDFRKYMRMAPNATILGNPTFITSSIIPPIYHIESLVWAGGELSRRSGELLNFSALAKICVLGEDLGDFELSGKLKTTFPLWNHPVSLSANGSIKNLHPDYFLENYVSNHFIWRNRFLNENKTLVQGNLLIPALGFEAHASMENINNLLYFNTSAVPDQYTGNVQVLSLNVRQHLAAGILNWDNDVTYQMSSNQRILPLPDLSLLSDLYLKFTLSKVLHSHLGFDCRYNTAYYAQAYMPAIGQFYNQKELKIGNYPMMNAYANFHLKRMRFFVMYSHISRFFVQPNYFSAPHYPINPAIVKVGLSWNFYD
ncbi:MAG TPA: putative porin [Bacteroidales bacterium]|nr:putative porin [Bacteroidales bacterium]